DARIERPAELAFERATLSAQLPLRPSRHRRLKFRHRAPAAQRRIVDAAGFGDLRQRAAVREQLDCGQLFCIELYRHSASLQNALASFATYRAAPAAKAVAEPHYAWLLLRCPRSCGLGTWTRALPRCYP